MAKTTVKAPINEDNYTDLENRDRTQPLDPIVKEGEGGEGDGGEGGGEPQPQPDDEPLPPPVSKATRTQALDEYMAGNRHIGERVRVWHPFAADSDVGLDNAKADYDRLIAEEAAKAGGAAIMKSSG